MKTFKVLLSSTVSATFEVEAENEKDLAHETRKLWQDLLNDPDDYTTPEIEDYEEI